MPFFSQSHPNIPTKHQLMAIWLLSFSFVIISINAYAQTGQATPSTAKTSATLSVGAPVQVLGVTLDQRHFDIRQLRGKVALIVVWRTDCAVCREQMRELRENTKGWSDKPFATVLINTDNKLADIQAYNSFINQVLPASERLSQLWLHEPQFKDNLGLQQLQTQKTNANVPHFFVVNQRGELVERHTGRLPADVWERIAFLL